MSGERSRPSRRLPGWTGLHKLAAVVSLLHYLGTYISVSLSEPGVGEPSLVPGAEVWKGVLGFPLVTLHDAIFGPFGPGSFGQGGRRLAVLFWIGGNSFLWGTGFFYAVRAISGRFRDRR